ncbi:MAG: hypothetical protein ACI4NM_01035 [Bullifex sp.]
MNYEEFLESFRSVSKSVKDAAAKAAAIEKKMSRNAENGDYRSLEKDITSLENTALTLSDAAKELSSCISSFDSKGYFTSGDFTSELVGLLRSKGLDVLENNPSYEVFPTRIRIGAEEQEVIIGKKKTPTMRPAVAADTAAAIVAKLNSASFNASGFAQDLENAYLSCILAENEKAGAKKFTWGAHISLLNCYKAMTPLSRSRKEYDETAFAFDLARLYREYAAGTLETKSGKRISFGTARGKAVRILDAYGQEQLLSSVSFV